MLSFLIALLIAIVIAWALFYVIDLLISDIRLNRLLKVIVILVVLIWFLNRLHVFVLY